MIIHAAGSIKKIQIIDIFGKTINELCEKENIISNSLEEKIALLNKTGKYVVAGFNEHVGTIFKVFKLKQENTDYTYLENHCVSVNFEKYREKILEFDIIYDDSLNSLNELLQMIIY